MQFIKLILLLFPIFAWSNLPELTTKISVKSIRYISPDGKTTYFQNRQGELKFSSNYNIQTLFTGKEHDQFLIEESFGSKKLLISHIKNPHRYNANHSNAIIYWSEKGTKLIEKIGEGVRPRLHLNGNFASFYDREQNDLVIYNFSSKSEKRIKLSEKNSPYFIPEAIMTNPNFVIYSDINNKDYAAVLLYDLAEKKFQTLYKSQISDQKLNLCFREPHLIVGEFPLHNMGANSTITQLNIYSPQDNEKTNVLYTSSLVDLGQMICQNDNIYFVKTILHQDKINFKTTEVAKIELSTGKLNILTNLNDITQIFPLANMIVTNYKGKFYVIDGKQEVIDDSLEVKP